MCAVSLWRNNDKDLRRRWKKSILSRKSFVVWNGPARVFSLFRHIRGIYVVTQKNNGAERDLCRIKENNYKSTDTRSTIIDIECNKQQQKYLLQEKHMQKKLFFTKPLIEDWTIIFNNINSKTINIQNLKKRTNNFTYDICRNPKKTKKNIECFFSSNFPRQIWMMSKMFCEMRHFLRTGERSATQISHFLCR